VISVNAAGWVFKKPNNLNGNWETIPNSCCVHDYIATIHNVARGAFSEQPGRCYLKSIGTGRSVNENKCAVSGSFVKMNDEGEPIVPKVVTYSARMIGWGDHCGDAHYHSAFAQINGQKAHVARGINVYLIRSDGSFQYAQSDTHNHEAWHTRGGGDRAVIVALRQALNVKDAIEQGYIGVIVGCHDECQRQLPSEIRQQVLDLGARNWLPDRLPFYRSATLFIKDLRSGLIHSDLSGAGGGHGCEWYYRSGHFKL